MAGSVRAFVRMQGLVVLVKEWVDEKDGVGKEEEKSVGLREKKEKKDKDKEKEKKDKESKEGSSTPNPHIRPTLHSFRFYASSPQSSSSPDISLGTQIEQLCSNAPCLVDGCTKARREHGVKWICGGWGFEGRVSEEGNEKGGDGDDEKIRVWQSCKVCGMEAEKRAMSDGA